MQTQAGISISQACRLAGTDGAFVASVVGAARSAVLQRAAFQIERACVVNSFDNVSMELKYKPLRKDQPLGLLDDACLPLRAPRYASCRACESVCPVKAIHVDETELRLDESCLRCGRCAAACAMGALGLPGFSVPEVPKHSARALSVDCWKVPAKLSPEGSVRVPCLGGLSSGRIVELAAEAGTNPLELLDRGWCLRCSAGSIREHPVHASLAQVRSLLEAAGCGVSRLPRLRSLHLPADLMPAEIPPAVAETKMSRRGFFSALTAKATVAIDQVKPLGSGLEPRRRRGFEREPMPSRERRRLLGGLQQIGQSAWVSQPPGLFHRVEVSAACNNHQLCASICPTGALAVFDEPGRTELIFDTRLCIGCNECHAVCPSGALSLLPNGYSAGGEALPDHPIRLTSFSEKFCTECGQQFTDRVGEDHCPQCEKRRNLASSAFRSLFGSAR